METQKIQKFILQENGEKVLHVVKGDKVKKIKGWKKYGEKDFNFTLSKIYTKPELEEIFRNFDWSKVEKCLLKIVGFPVSFKFSKIEIDKYNVNYKVIIEDFEVPLKKLGLFGKLLRDSQLTLWSSWIGIDSNDENASLWFNFTYHLDWHHKGGGRNGTTVARVRVNMDNGEIYFEKLEDKFKKF